ncbi:uncharacterized protein LOC119341556 [Triticum dicoccoides]|uniref:uncharacterized protein LOC119341556 n=1 Tax=Triticum dicoccoides TaxID=85692 RepID=UPI001890C406|nr:uncharacterized protein LOC119341556 [Triticum dicoccoides]
MIGSSSPQPRAGIGGRGLTHFFSGWDVAMERAPTPPPPPWTGPFKVHDRDIVCYARGILLPLRHPSGWPLFLYHALLMSSSLPVPWQRLHCATTTSFSTVVQVGDGRLGLSVFCWMKQLHVRHRRQTQPL